MPIGCRPPTANFMRTLTIVGAGLAAGALCFAGGAQAATFKLLHTFCQEFNCGDGNSPSESLAIDLDGNLYGVAQGGAHQGGVVFALIRKPGGKLRYKVLYHFCALNDCLDGEYPIGPLILDAAGDLYGVTGAGGSADESGTVFRLSPNADRSKWNLATLYNFCSAKSSCPDGEFPSGSLTYAGAQSGALYDGQSMLYGLTYQGGRHFAGVAYSLTPSPQGQWSQRTLYAFCAKGAFDCTDGQSPWFGATLDAAGNLYGVTSFGGANRQGVVFKLSPSTQTRRWQETVLHNFCSLANCADGWTSLSGLTIDGSGNLYGASWRGGVQCGSNGCGLVYRVAPEGTETTLYEFCALTNCADGSEPLDQGGLILDEAGNIYGTTCCGGDNREGTVFRLSGTTLQTLYSFCPQSGCADGAEPRAGVIMDSSGDLFGVTQNHGATSGGTVFELVP